MTISIVAFLVVLCSLQLHYTEVALNNRVLAAVMDLEGAESFILVITELKLAKTVLPENVEAVSEAQFISFAPTSEDEPFFPAEEMITVKLEADMAENVDEDTIFDSTSTKMAM